MNEEQKMRVQDLVKELDALVPRTDAVVVMKQYGGGCDESQMTGTAIGYLRFGIEFLTASFLPPIVHGEKLQVDVDLEYLISWQSDVGFNYFYLDNTLQSDALSSDEIKQPWKDKALGITCGLFCLLLLYATTIGFVTIARWFFKFFL